MEPNPENDGNQIPTIQNENFDPELIKKAALVINPKIKRYKYDEVDEILNSEFPIDYPITDSRMPCLSLACSLPEKTA